jgi:hypothetical protein
VNTIITYFHINSNPQTYFETAEDEENIHELLKNRPKRQKFAQNV